MAKKLKLKSKKNAPTHEFVKKDLEELSDDVEIIDLSDMTAEEAADELNHNEKEATEKKVATSDKEEEKEDAHEEDVDDTKKLDEETDQTKKMEKELAQIYENEDGSLPDMHTFEKQKGGHVMRALLTLVSVLAFLGGAGWYGYTYLYHPSGTFVENDVILSIGGEEHVGFGEEVTYRVRFKNAQEIPLDNAVLELRYPAGFVFESSSREPDVETNNIWTLGPLEKEDGEYIDIIGKLYGDIDERQSFRVFLNYTPSNFSSIFQKVATQETTISGAPVRLTMSGPKQISQGVATSFTMEVSPDLEAGGGTLPSHLALVFEPDVAFVTQKMVPKEGATLSERLWLIENVDEHVTSTSYTITGAFAGGEGSLMVNVRLVGWQDGQSRSDAYTLAIAEKELAIEDQQLSISLVANGSQQDITVQPGEHVNATIVVKNNTEESLKNVRVRLMFDAPSSKGRSIMDWPSLEDAADGSIVGEQLSDTVRRGQITWSSGQLRDLREIKAGDQVTIDVSIPIKSGDDIDLASYESYEIALAGDAQYTIASGEETAAAAVPLVLTLNSDTTFDVRDEIDESTHTITWLIGNTFHALKDIEAEVDLYGEIAFSQDAAVVPAGEIVYNKAEKKLTWKVDSMPLSVDVLALQFPITLNQANPSQTQLTSKVRVTAIDEVTGKQILLIGNEVGL
ncbi:MAG: hypothetical protein CO029_02910 [Candidatus Magasanikbacteria bacterium CG_4_9_14_0_2_um_filter_41_10]|uniref:DUF11 domain-containing protein n=1 Tax=Candidatus Magasanikbacteria bacterium CG_4_10_14_0_2_um_filter_41_31 TaxID=1974639 RepID=A0A2M7V568_9BACT|nr:MAG: hypothetical protein AUJ37_01840 [Candidatus Magasanikbacteria bacterium CG1_02_41_34]PIZ93716.1 MAG: hypothetical protein COX83_01100 [Candidatus Magasanikbacteria bacterium CG_4_10_14_0_2_um_filter_41_31]PJC53406.1 MAG: hypothetical protein CO029_02910 [Candidatus Magasanikbacteria bacterium CG_4_9_14_0_2_um_filter_41_10]